MNFIDSSAHAIAKCIRRNYSEAGSEIALRYAISLLINTLTAICVAVIITFFTGHVAECIVGIISFIVIRYVSGGMHMSSSLSCCILSIIIFITISNFTFHYSVAFFIIDSLSLIIFIITAPNNIKNVSSINEKYYPLLKLISVIFVGCNFIINSTVLSAAFIIQAFLTTTISYKLRDVIERRIPNL
ncbi:accessory gene regulator B family protein [Paenibacillus sp. OAS669]|uniref:accessory gene regulator B family protein n=1 Tax=Paenibacillus sp. OAS669 TaxID=2663821 RepID=UPI00178BB5A4|nr:accessory gene regulator B [Paenibacillus sp. OAS669]